MIAMMFATTRIRAQPGMSTKEEISLLIQTVANAICLDFITFGLLFNICQFCTVQCSTLFNLHRSTDAVSLLWNVT